MCVCVCVDFEILFVMSCLVCRMSYPCPKFYHDMNINKGLTFCFVLCTFGQMTEVSL